MDRNYREKIGQGFNEGIFDVLNNDKKNIIRPAIEMIASLSPAASDIGCAVGKGLPVLSPAFKNVIAKV